MLSIILAQHFLWFASVNDNDQCVYPEDSAIKNNTIVVLLINAHLQESILYNPGINNSVTLQNLDLKV